MAASRPAVVRVLNVDQVLRDLDRLDAATADLQAFPAIAGTIAERAIGRVEVWSGALRATITPVTTENSAVVRAGDGLEYAGVVNYVNPGNEFLTGPANESEEESKKTIDATIDSEIRAAGLQR